ncbi:hypothetical protein ACU6ZK_02110 [Klebsiella aerogenes]
MESKTEKLRNLFSEIASSCGAVSDEHYVGMGVYQGVRNGVFIIPHNKMKDICMLLGIEIPKQTVWDSECDYIRGGTGQHQHSLHK